MLNSSEIADKDFRNKLAYRTPIALSLFFNTIMEIVLNTLIGYQNPDKCGVFGLILDYYVMVESQAREHYMGTWLFGLKVSTVQTDFIID
jgi:hypothetical protein